MSSIKPKLILLLDIKILDAIQEDTKRFKFEYMLYTLLLLLDELNKKKFNIKIIDFSNAPKNDYSYKLLDALQINALPILLEISNLAPMQTYSGFIEINEHIKILNNNGALKKPVAPAAPRSKSDDIEIIHDEFVDEGPSKEEISKAIQDQKNRIENIQQQMK